MSSRSMPCGNGCRVYEDAQQPDSDEVQEWFTSPDTRANGHLYKFRYWQEFVKQFTNNSSDIQSTVIATLGQFLTTNVVTGLAEKKVARYRSTATERADRTGADNFTNFFALVDGLNTNSSGDTYTTQMQGLVDVDQWMRVFALEDVVDNSDVFGNTGGKNIYAYKPPGEVWRLMLWDYDSGLGESSSCGPEIRPGENERLFYGASDFNDPVLVTLNNHPPFLRAYWRGIQDALNGPFAAARIEPLLNANYTALTNNGISAVSPLTVVTEQCRSSYTNSHSLKSWIDARRVVLSNELAKVAAPFAITNNNGVSFSTNSANILLGGKAPMEVANIRINSTTSNAPVTWGTVTNWVVSVALNTGTNLFTVRGYDRLNASNAVATITITRQ